MTTPAHCTRTYPHEAHGPAFGYAHCEGVDPPADVAATPDPRYIRSGQTTDQDDDEAMRAFVSRQWSRDDAPDPRLDVIRRALDLSHDQCWSLRETAQHVHNALSDWEDVHAVFSAEDAPCTTAKQQIACPWRWAYNEHIGAPDRLTAAQEIRLQLACAMACSNGYEVADIPGYVAQLAPMVEYGPDKTSDTTGDRQ